MSELKSFLLALKSGNSYSEAAIIELFEQAWQENADLRAKLDAAEKAKNMIIKDRDGLRETINDMNDQLDEISNLYEKSASEHYRKYLNMKQERDNLQKQLDEQCKTNNGLNSLNKFLSDQTFEWTEKYGELEEKHYNLQAANGVLREALVEEKIRLITECLDCSYERANSNPGEVNVCGCGKTERIDAINKALSATQSEAGEKVRGLVEAAQWLYNILDDCHECDGLPGCQICEAAVKLQGSLIKYRGGKE